MRKNKSVKRHSVWANMQIAELSKLNSALSLEIYSGKDKIGTMEIGRGSFAWYGRKKQIRKRFSWTQFAKLMDEY